ncbi:MAG: RNA polymerase sigma factor [Planctomycetaceae bacterium]|nr:RNA polymerase sigma factor [Planctomycetaceae bacterium]
MAATPAQKELIRRIREGEERAWRTFIAEYEGRLQAFAFSRLRDRALAEDLVQETFLGFLTALPNYDENTPPESFLFAITANKITDALRKAGRRPTLPLHGDDSDGGQRDPVGRDRVASSIARSRESQRQEETVLVDCLRTVIRQCREKGDYERLKCIELLFVRGFPNKRVATVLGITEQAVANHKFFVVSKLKDAAKSAPVPIELSPYGLAEE